MTSIRTGSTGFSTADTVLVACTIDCGGFSGERTFRVLAGDGGYYACTSPVSYCLDEDLVPIGDGYPPKGCPVPGYVMGMVVDAPPGRPARIHVPSGDVLDINPEGVAFVRETVSRWVALDGESTAR